MGEKVLIKCPKCDTDVFSGQRFCANCGAEQKIPMRNLEEIQQMRDLIKELSKKPGGDKENISSMIFSFSAYMAADTALKWAMGFATNEELHKIINIGKGGNDGT